MMWKIMWKNKALWKGRSVEFRFRGGDTEANKYSIKNDTLKEDTIVIYNETLYTLGAK